MAAADGQNWALLVEGLGGPLMGFALSSLSRGYRERRAQLLAKEKAAQATQKADQDAFQEKVLKTLDELTRANIANREELASLKSAQETLVSVGTFLRGHEVADQHARGAS